MNIHFVIPGANDFEPLERFPLNLSLMDQESCVNITIIGDSIIEDSEFFYITFEVEESMDAVTSITPSSQVTVTILDDDDNAS